MNHPQKKTNSPFLKKIRFKYRISFVDETTLTKVLSFRISPLYLFLYFCLFTFITFTLLTVLIFATPIRNYLPGYGQGDERNYAIEELMRTDSLRNQLKLQANYLESIKRIIAGEASTEDIAPLDSFVIENQMTNINPNKLSREDNFVKKFEEEEKYNLSAINIKPESSNIDIFHVPSKGIIDKRYNEKEGFYGISIITRVKQNVMSILEGTVVFADYSFENGWIIQVQHNNNYLSVYKNNTKLLKQLGDQVKAGESIAITGNKEDKEANFYFELWYQGNAIDPEELIIF